VQLLAEIVDGRLVVLHFCRALALRDGIGDLRVEAGLEGKFPVCIPLELRGPVARDDEDRELVEARGQRAVEADVFADRCTRSARSGLRSNALKGPRAPPRGPETMAS